MSKDGRSPSCNCRASSFSHSYKDADNKSPSPPIGNENEFEEARCPICMEHPHNAVLLLCSSYEKGCRPYMCDTSPRHSNCLDQFRKSTKLACPFCRGQINGWTVVNSAREFMNSKTRNCSLSTCAFDGNYSQLSEHARQEHPFVRPTDEDPEHEIQWRTLQEELERQDVFNMQFAPNDGDDVVDFMTVMSRIIGPNWHFDLDNMIASYSSNGSVRQFSWATDDETRLLGRPPENPQTTRNRTSTHVGQGSNGQPSSRNHR